MEHARAFSPPSGLIACRIGTRQLRIVSITPCSVDLDCDFPLPDQTDLRFSFYQIKSGAYRSFSVCARKDATTPALRFVFQHSACADAIRKTLADWSEYVNMKLFSHPDDPEAFAKKYLGYPADDESFCETIADQYHEWFVDLHLCATTLPCSEIALTLDLPSAWNAYLAQPLPDFLHHFALSKHLPAAFLDSIPLQRLYIGSEHCFHLFPDQATLAALLCKAQKERLALSFCTPIVHQAQTPEMQRRLSSIVQLSPHAETIFNDWGVLSLLRSRFPTLSPVLGTLLNRFRRDARLPWKAGISQNEALISQNALNDSTYLTLLSSHGVERFEYACGTLMRPVGKSRSLHFPFSPTNTSAYCPLRAYIETGARGKQGPSAVCGAYCENNFFLYPSSLSMLQRGCSLFHVSRALPEPSYLRRFDRLVLNF